MAHLTHERRLAAHTAANYQRDIESLIELAGDTALEQLQTHHIRRFVAQRHAHGLDGRSIARMLSAWRGFYRYLVRDHGMRANPCVGIRAPKAAKKLPHALSVEQAGRLMDVQTGGDEDGLATRDKAMFELFYSLGLRLSELTGLDIADINTQDGVARITGKGNKTRVVPVGKQALAALAAWTPQRALLAPAHENALFVNRHGARIGPRAVQYRIKHWALKLGLDASVHPHVLRHSFASHMLQSSSDLRAVQEMLGHASISTTQVYTSLDFQHLAKVYDAAHPRAKRKA